MENKDIIEQMKRIQLGMSANLNESNKNEFNRNIEFSGGEGVNIDSSRNKVSISTSPQGYVGATGSTGIGATGPRGATGPQGPQGPQGPGFVLPSGDGVLGISNGSLFVYGTTECE